MSTVLREQEPVLDVDVLRQAIQEEYDEVASHPQKGFRSSIVALLREGEDVFVEKILERVSPTPPNHYRIVEFNRAGELPEVDLTELEAGANRCTSS